MAKKDKVGLIKSYIELFMDENISTGKFLYKNNEIIKIIYGSKDSILGDSISIKTENGLTRRIDIIKLVKSKDFNFGKLFLKNYKYYYEKNDIGYNELIDQIIDEIQNKGCSKF